MEKFAGIASRISIVGLFALSLSSLTSCGSGGTSNSSNINHPPIANAGANLTVARDTTVQLDGTKSTDPDGDLLSYVWSIRTKPGSSQVTINAPTSQAPNFSPDVPGSYVLSLIVSDGKLSSVASDVTITVSDTPSPAFVAGQGTVLTSFQDPASLNAIALQADGKIIASGASTLVFVRSAAVMVRYNRDGSVDTTFGQSGKVSTQCAGQNGIYNLIVEPSGDILASGLGCFLIKYKANGTVDPTFGNNGYLTDTDLGTPNSLALQTDGKILVAGAGSTSYIKRFSASGVVDATFGTLGTIQLPNSLNAITALDSGKFLVSSIRRNADGSSEVHVLRFNSDGTADASFGASGEIISRFNGALSANSRPYVLTTGQIFVACGYVPLNASAQYYAIARFTAEGKVDQTFGNGGQIFATSTGFELIASGVGSDDKILLGGRMPRGSGASDFATLRLTKDGQSDATWGTGGLVTTDFGISDEVRSILMQPDGKVVAAGNAGLNFVQYFALARYKSDGTPDK